MKNLRLNVLLGTLALLLVATVMLQPAAFAQQDSPSQQPSAQQDKDPATQPGMTQQSDSQTFKGKIAKADGKLVLQDEVSGATYSLDDQDRAKSFAGKSVKVTGKLDPQTNTIRVASIEPAS